jgi:hypothetical protein
MPGTPPATNRLLTPRCQERLARLDESDPIGYTAYTAESE